MGEDFLEHQRVRLALGFVGCAGDIEVSLPSMGTQDAIQPASCLARGNGQAITVGAQRLKRLEHTRKQR
ncbi:hypothetical protein D3C81_1838670 [compost metagenome]